MLPTVRSDQDSIWPSYLRAVLLDEALAEAGLACQMMVHQLDCYFPLESDVVGVIDRPYTSYTEQAIDSIVA